MQGKSRTKRFGKAGQNAHGYDAVEMMTVNIQKTTIKGAVCLLLAFVGACVQEGEGAYQDNDAIAEVGGVD